MLHTGIKILPQEFLIAPRWAKIQLSLQSRACSCCTGRPLSLLSICFWFSLFLIVFHCFLCSDYLCSHRISYSLPLPIFYLHNWDFFSISLHLPCPAPVYVSRIYSPLWFHAHLCIQCIRRVFNYPWNQLLYFLFHSRVKGNTGILCSKPGLSEICL